MDCVACSPGFDSCSTQFFSFLALVCKKEMEPVMIKLHEIASPSRKNPTLIISVEVMEIIKSDDFSSYSVLMVSSLMLIS